jgi:hypothetical protein
VVFSLSISLFSFKAPDISGDDFEQDVLLLFRQCIDLFEALEEFGVFEAGLSLFIFIPTDQKIDGSA